MFYYRAKGIFQQIFIDMHMQTIPGSNILKDFKNICVRWDDSSAWTNYPSVRGHNVRSFKWMFVYLTDFSILDSHFIGENRTWIFICVKSAKAVCWNQLILARKDQIMLSTRVCSSVPEIIKWKLDM